VVKAKTFNRGERRERREKREPFLLEKKAVVLSVLSGLCGETLSVVTVNE
jgi:hypothetical protein